MQQIPIYFKSDFKLFIKTEAGFAVPFKFEFYTNMPSRPYIVKYDGHKYHNCELLEDGRLCIAFDDHGFGLGKLMIRQSYYLNDADYASEICDRVIAPQPVVNIDENLLRSEIVLALSGDDTIEFTSQLPPYYQAGLTPEEHQALIDATVHAEESAASANEQAGIATEAAKAADEARQALTTAYNEKVAVLDSDYAQKKAALEADYSGVKNALSSDYASVKAQLDADYAATKEALSTDYATALAGLNDRMTAIESQFSADCEAWNKSVADFITASQATFDGKLTDWQSQVDAAIADITRLQQKDVEQDQKLSELEGAMRDFCSGMFTENKAINAQGQEVVRTNLYCTGFLPVKNRILAYGYEGANNGYPICSFYDKDKVFISSYVGASVPTYMAIDLTGDDIPSNAYYFRINSYVAVIDKSYAIGDVQDFLVSFIEENGGKIGEIETEIKSLDLDGIRTDIAAIEEILNIGTEAVDVASVNEKTNAYVNNSNRSMQNLGGAFGGKIYKVAFYPIVRGANYQLVIPKTGANAAFMNAAYTNNSNPAFSQAIFTNVDGSTGDDSAKTLNFIAEDYSFVAVSYAYSNEDGSIIYGNPSLSYTREKTDSVTELRGEVDSINPDPRIILPSKIYAAVGVEFNLYKDAIVLGIDKGLASPANFSVEIVSNVGNDYERVYSLTPISSQVGEHPIVINVYDSNRKLVATKTSSLVVIDNVAPASVKNILMIGDSTLDLGDVTTTLIGDFVGNAPKTWGANTRQFPLLNQGIGGWGVVNYTERGSVYKMYATDYKLYTSVKQSGADLRTHSVYKNETDTQRIEINQVFTDKFQYVIRKGTPVSGTYTKVSGGGDDTLTLNILSSEYGNPFWNPDSNTLDLAYYKSRIGFNGSFDVVTMRMGINDAIFKNIHSNSDFDVTLNRYKSLVDLFVADGAKVIVELPLTDVSDHDAWGVNAGAGSANAGKNMYQADMWRWREAIIETFDNGAYGNNVEVGCAGLCVDRWYGYPATGTIAPVMSGKVATRLGVTSLMHNNYVHPNNGGYMQLADALYPQLLRLLIVE